MKKLTTVCKDCNKPFTRTPGVRYVCLDCRKCKWCDTVVSSNPDNGHIRRFCNQSCFGKYNTANSPAVKEHIRKMGLTGWVAATDATRGKAFPERRGENSPHWKGGRGSERKAMMGQIEYRTWRIAVFTRDNFLCQECNQRGGKLHAHHIIPYVADPSKALDVSNGQTLCVPCHRKTPSWGINARKFIPSQLSI